MPQLMPLNWFMSIIMFFIILISISWIFSVKIEMKKEKLSKNFNLYMNKWFW